MAKNLDFGKDARAELMAGVDKLAQAVKGEITGYSPQSIDESFGDDYLRKSDRSPNRASFKELQLRAILYNSKGFILGIGFT